jgi:hypothetical protein
VIGFVIGFRDGFILFLMGGAFLEKIDVICFGGFVLVGVGLLFLSVVRVEFGVVPGYAGGFDVEFVFEGGGFGV